MLKQRTANWQRAQRAAQAILYGPESIRLARSILVHLRTEIAAGVPPKALLDRIDDELFKLARREEAGKVKARASPSL